MFTILIFFSFFAVIAAIDQIFKVRKKRREKEYKLKKAIYEMDKKKREKGK